VSKTYYVSIGNSDDKLTQQEWRSFIDWVDGILFGCQRYRHGTWFSLPNAAFQNACWCVEVDDDWDKHLRKYLAEAAAKFRQDSIALATATTEFIQPQEGSD